MNNSQDIDLNSQAVYEISVCSICLDDLSQSIVSLSCGHCFHRKCILKYFQQYYYSLCPYCKTTIYKRSIRPIIYQAQKKKQNQQPPLPPPPSQKEKQYIKKLICDTFQDNDKLKQELKEFQEKRYQQTEMLFELEIKLNCVTKRLQEMTQCYQKETEKLQKQQREIEEFTRKEESNNQQLNTQQTVITELQTKVQTLELQLKDKEDSLIDLINSHNTLKDHYEQLRSYVNELKDDSQDIINLKSELQKNTCSPTFVADLFYDRLLLANKELITIRDKINSQLVTEHQSKISNKENVFEFIQSKIKNEQGIETKIFRTALETIEGNVECENKVKLKFDLIEEQSETINTNIGSTNSQVSEQLNQNIVSMPLE